MIQPFFGAQALLRLTNTDTLNLFLNTWTILAVAVDEENVCESFALVFKKKILG